VPFSCPLLTTIALHPAQPPPVAAVIYHILLLAHPDASTSCCGSGIRIGQLKGQVNPQNACDQRSYLTARLTAALAGDVDGKGNSLIR